MMQLVPGPAAEEAKYDRVRSENKEKEEAVGSVFWISLKRNLFLVVQLCHNKKEVVPKRSNDLITVSKHHAHMSFQETGFHRHQASNNPPPQMGLDSALAHPADYTARPLSTALCLHFMD